MQPEFWDENAGAKYADDFSMFWESRFPKNKTNEFLWSLVHLLVVD